MSVGFRLTSTAWKRGWFRAAPGVEELAKEVRRVYREHLADDRLAARLEVRTHGDAVHARFHPAEEGLELELIAGRRIRAAANTSVVGPGYHAHLIALLDRLAKALGIRWNIEPGDDETDFAMSRDRSALEHHMQQWLRAVCGTCLAQRDDLRPLGLGMPLEAPRPEHDALAYSTMGIWREDQFSLALESEPALRALAESYFAWWGDGMDARFWLGLAHAVCWCDVPWVTPRDEGERASAAFALACFDRAHALDPALDVSTALEELRQLTAEGAAVTTPREEGIGHRRVRNTFPALGGWTLELPGHFARHVQEDGQYVSFKAGSRSVWGSVFEIVSSSGAKARPEDLLGLAKLGEPELTWEAGGAIGAARWMNGDEGRQLRAALAVDGSMIALALSDDSRESTNWQEAVAKSARPPTK